jgi:hypothetical protein
MSEQIARPRKPSQSWPLEDEIEPALIELNQRLADVGPCRVCSYCSICGCAPCGTPGFCRMWREADRKSAERRWDPVNHRRLVPQTLIEAVMYCVRARGLAALKEPANLERLRQCDARARAEIDRRLNKLFESGV